MEATRRSAGLLKNTFLFSSIFEITPPQFISEPIAASVRLEIMVISPAFGTFFCNDVLTGAVITDRCRDGFCAVYGATAANGNQHFYAQLMTALCALSHGGMPRVV